LKSAGKRKPFAVGERVILLYVLGAAEEVICTAKSNESPTRFANDTVARDGEALLQSLDDQ
jgi:hypothetical protein